MSGNVLRILPEVVLVGLARSSVVGPTGSGLPGVVAHLSADAAAAVDADSLAALDRSNAAPEHACISHAAPRSPAT